MRGIDFVSGADGARMDGADGRGVGLAGGVACLPANNIWEDTPLRSTSAEGHRVGKNLVESSHEYVAGSGILVPMRNPGNVQIQRNICGI